MVRVNESWEERAALKVDNFCRAVGEGRDVRSGSGREDFSPADRKRIDRLSSGRHWIDHAVAEDRLHAVGGPGLTACDRPDRGSGRDGISDELAPARTRLPDAGRQPVRDVGTYARSAHRSLLEPPRGARSTEIQPPVSPIIALPEVRLQLRRLVLEPQPSLPPSARSPRAGAGRCRATCRCSMPRA
jgi:hypothetical protein